jgi:hypothetical protein
MTFVIIICRANFSRQDIAGFCQDVARAYHLGMPGVSKGSKVMQAAMSPDKWDNVSEQFQFKLSYACPKPPDWPE